MGSEEHFTFADPTRLGQGGTPQVYEVTRMFDRQRRLTRMRIVDKHVAIPSEIQTIEFKDYIQCGTFSYPKVIISKLDFYPLTLTSGKRVYGVTDTYTLQTVKIGSLDGELFACNRPPRGTVVRDFRYITSNEPDGITYSFKPQLGAVDAASKLALRQATARTTSDTMAHNIQIVKKSSAPVDFTLEDTLGNTLKLSLNWLR
jgi:hypothetical protein